MSGSENKNTTQASFLLHMMARNNRLWFIFATPHSRMIIYAAFWRAIARLIKPKFIVVAFYLRKNVMLRKIWHRIEARCLKILRRYKLGIYSGLLLSHRISDCKRISLLSRGLIHVLHLIYEETRFIIHKTLRVVSFCENKSLNHSPEISRVAPPWLVVCDLISSHHIADSTWCRIIEWERTAWRWVSDRTNVSMRQEHRINKD